MSKVQPAETKYRILLVDDHDDLRQMMSMMLKKRRDYAVETASSGQQALDKAEQFSPHLVISDIAMPGMSGMRMMEELREKSLAPFKSIAISGYDLQQEQNSGYDVHMTKPVDFDELFDTIDQLTQTIPPPGGKD